MKFKQLFLMKSVKKLYSLVCLVKKEPLFGCDVVKHIYPSIIVLQIKF